MDREDIKLPEEALFEASVLIRSILIGGRTFEYDTVELNLTTGSTFVIDISKLPNPGSSGGVDPSIGFGHVINSSNIAHDDQDLLWVGHSSFVDPARKIAIDRYMYLQFNMFFQFNTLDSTVNLTNLFFPENGWSSENFIGLEGRISHARPGSEEIRLTINVMFRVDQRQINRLPRFLYPPGDKLSAIRDAFGIRFQSTLSRANSHLTLNNDVTLTRGPSTDLYTPNPATKVSFALNHGTTNRLLGVSRTQGRTNAFPVPVFSSFYCGGIPTTTANYSTLFVKQNIARNMLAGVTLDASKDGNPGVETSITVTSSTTNASIDMDFIAPMPRYTSNGAVNPGVKYDITLSSGAATCYVVDFGGVSRDLIHHAINITGDPAGTNRRVYLRSFTTLTRGTQTTVTITRAMMILFPTTETATSSSFTINYSDTQ